jgi:hypothetical protein
VWFLNWEWKIARPFDPSETLMADVAFANKLASLGFALPEGHTPPSEKLVREFEQRFSLSSTDADF